MPRRVFIINKSAHDYSEAKEFGDLVFLSSGPMKRYGVNAMHRQFFQILRESDPDDLLLLSGLTVMNCVAVSIFVSMHGKVNFLLFTGRRYLERNIVL